MLFHFTLLRANLWEKDILDFGVVPTSTDSCCPLILVSGKIEKMYFAGANRCERLEYKAPTLIRVVKPSRTIWRPDSWVTHREMECRRWSASSLPSSHGGHRNSSRVDCSCDYLKRPAVKPLAWSPPLVFCEGIRIIGLHTLSTAAR